MLIQLMLIQISLSLLAPSIKYVTLFLANFYPPLSHFVTHPGIPPESTSHISDPPIFSRPSTTNPDKSPLYKFSLKCSRGVFGQEVLSGGLLSGRFCLRLFLSIPLSVRIHLLQQKVKHNLKFHVSYV